MTTQERDAALREMEEAYQSLVPGTWMNHAEGTLRVCWPTIRDALTAQGEAFTSVHVVMREGPFPIKAIHDSRAGAEADAAMRGQDYEVETWRIQRGDPAPSAPRPTHAANVVGTCDWGDCDGETVGVRLDSDAQWLAVCAQHSPVCRAMDAIWRLANLPFSDNDRHKIQNIALAWIDGTGPREGSAVAQWLADPAPSAPPASETVGVDPAGDSDYVVALHEFSPIRDGDHRRCRFCMRGKDVHVGAAK